MEREKYSVIFFLLLVTAGCCNALVPSKSIKIPPYLIDYYAIQDMEKVPAEEKLEGWYHRSWKSGFQMFFKLQRVEESGIYFYKLHYRALNGGNSKVAIEDKDIHLIESTSNMGIERVECWNWQQVSYPCNVAVLSPGEEVVKEVRFGYSIDEHYAPGLKVKLNDLGVTEGEVIVEFYARPGS